MTKEIDTQYEVKRGEISVSLAKASDVSVTIDIWTDRKMRSYVGVTAHYMLDGGLKSALLTCQRFTGNISVCIRKSFAVVEI